MGLFQLTFRSAGPAELTFCLAGPAELTFCYFDLANPGRRVVAFRASVNKRGSLTRAQK